jgi:hypothetical protein
LSRGRKLRNIVSVPNFKTYSLFMFIIATSSRLAQSLPAVLSHAGVESFGERYAVCPNPDCNTIVLLASLSRSIQSYCMNCNSGLMKQSRQRYSAPIRYTPKLVFNYHSLISQLKNLLSRPDIIAAIRTQQTQLYHPARDPNSKDDIQHGRIWAEMEGPGGKPFFTRDGNEIGLILALDW